MGIKDLNKLLKDECGEYTRDVPMRDFANKRIAIDAPLYLHKYIHTHDRRFIVDAYVELIVRLLENKITPVFVFDGEAPPEKKFAQEKRASERRRQEERVARMERDMAESEIPSQFLLANYKRYVKTPVGALVDVEYDRERMVTYIEKLRSRIVNVCESDYALLKETLDAMGVPWMRAPHEAEMLCVQLCKQGLVAAVMSTDTDALVAGGPVIVRDMKNDRFVCVYYDEVLEKLRMTPEQFTDLCIMCGTDFNQNVPRIGWKRSLKLIRQHGRIEDVPIEGKDVLNHVNVRRLFKHEHWPHPLPAQKPISYEALAGFFASKGSSADVCGIMTRIGQLPIVVANVMPNEESQASH